MHDILELKVFCKHCKNIYCYGAGEYGNIVGLFLEDSGIKIEGFLVTDGAEGEVCGKPVYNIDEVKNQLDENVGIIIALSDKYHKEVLDTINQLTACRVLVLSDNDIIYMRSKISHKLLIRDIMSEGKDVNDDDIIKQYEARYSSIIREYEMIEFDYVHMAQIGGLANWIMLVDELENQDKHTYYVYYPFVYKNKGFAIHNMPNQIAARKCKGGRFEVISDESVDFWKYVLINHFDHIKIKSGYSPEQSSECFNKYAISRHASVGKRYMELSRHEEQIGNEFLQKFGINQFICIANRDSSYRHDVMRIQDKELEIVDIYRNSDIDNFDFAANMYQKEGIRLVRMGAKVECAVSAESAIFDYASNYRTELLDLYLSEKCMFMISDPSGIQVLPILFGKPIIMINTSVLTTKFDYLLPSNEDIDLMILQKLWDKKNERYLTIREMIQHELLSRNANNLSGRPASTFRNYWDEDIVPCKNTPREIYDVMKEMQEQINGSVEYDEVDVELRKKFKCIMQEYAGEYFFRYRIGKKFLRENQWLLD